MMEKKDIKVVNFVRNIEEMMEYKAKQKTAYWLPIRSSKIRVKSRKKSPLATFQDSLKVTLVIGQCFSLMPVSGVMFKDSKKVRFYWRSWKTLYCVCAFMGQVFMTIMTCINSASHNAMLKSMTSIVFYFTSITAMIMFLRIAVKWPKLTETVAKIEEIDPSYDKYLKNKCNITCAVVLGLALVEHILSWLTAFAGAITCYPELHTYEGYVKHFYPEVFNYLPYFTIAAIATQFLHFQSTFIWNFSDLFVICMSYFLTSRLDKVNKKLLAAQGKYLPESFWRTVREEYCRATQIARKVDEVISGIVFISFANNLFFICLQLFNTLENGLKGAAVCNKQNAGNTPLKGYEAASYYLFSLVYLISRSIAVSLIAAQVNTASNVPAVILFDVPSPVYCTEVQRFLDQVNTDMVALSGMQFFNVTRGLLLTDASPNRRRADRKISYRLDTAMKRTTFSHKTNVESEFDSLLRRNLLKGHFPQVAGTIVTYELVMFQFNNSPPPLTSVVQNITSILSTTGTTAAN